MWVTLVVFRNWISHSLLLLPSRGRFNINLQSGAAVDPRDDTPLHISIRPGDKKIVRNSFVGGAWQTEERDGKCSIGAGETFELQIKVKESSYTLKVDGKKFCKFKHRLPIDQIRFVHICGGGVIESITEEGGWWCLK